MHPLWTDDGGTMGTAGVEVELSTSVGLQEPGVPRAGWQHAAVLHVGLLDNVDLGLTVGLLADIDGADWSFRAQAPAVELKARLIDGGGSTPAGAVRVTYIPGTVHQVEALGIATWERSPLMLSVNLGAQVGVPETGSALGSLTGAAAVGYSVWRTVLLMGEAVWHYPPGAAATVDMLVGAAWEVAPSRWLSLGTGMQVDGGGVVGWTVTVAATAGLDPWE